jgi:DNA-binding protein HU-beta
MNKAELILKIAEHKDAAGLKKTQVEFVLNETLELIKKSVKKEDVILIGFGTFSKSKRKARMGRNPQTGKELKIPARTVPKFKAGKGFRDLVR